MSYIIAIFCGSYLHMIQKKIRMRYLHDGVNYYNEVHHSNLNKIVHGIFMYNVVRGFFIAVPNIIDFICIKLFNRSLQDSFKDKLRIFYFLFLLSHYFQINFKVSIVTSIIYSTALYSSLNKNSWNDMLNGIGLLVLSLFVQETIGHWLGGDPPSRLNISAVSNALVYAPFCAVDYILGFIEDS